MVGGHLLRAAGAPPGPSLGAIDLGFQVGRRGVWGGGGEYLYLWWSPVMKLSSIMEKMDYNSRAIYEGDADIKKHVDFIVTSRC